MFGLGRYIFSVSTREEQPIVFALMVSFVVIVAAVLCKHPRQRTLAEQDQFGQALLFHRTDPTLCERIQIRALGGQLNRLYATACQRGPKRSTELRIPIMQHITAGMKIAQRFLRRTTSDLFHPFFIWMSGDPGYLHAPALQMEKEQHIIGHQTSPIEYFYSKEIATLWRSGMAGGFRSPSEEDGNRLCATGGGL